MYYILPVHSSSDRHLCFCQLFTIINNKHGDIESFQVFGYFAMFLDGQELDHAQLCSGLFTSSIFSLRNHYCESPMTICSAKIELGLAAYRPSTLSSKLHSWPLNQYFRYLSRSKINALMDFLCFLRISAKFFYTGYTNFHPPRLPLFCPQSLQHLFPTFG